MEYLQYLRRNKYEKVNKVLNLIINGIPSILNRVNASFDNPGF